MSVNRDKQAVEYLITAIIIASDCYECPVSGGAGGCGIENPWSNEDLCRQTLMSWAYDGEPPESEE